MDGTHRRLLHRYYSLLVENISVTVEFLANFVSMDIFTPEMVNIIEVQKTNSEKVFKLINLLLRRGPDAFKMFIRILQKDYKWLASKLTKAEEIFSADLYMSYRQKDQLRRYRHLIEENVKLDDIWSHVEHIFSPLEEMEIQRQPNPKETMKKMLDILFDKSDVAFDHLVDALRQVDRRLAGLLEHGASGEEEPVNPTIYNAGYIYHNNEQGRNLLQGFDRAGRNEDFCEMYQSILRQYREMRDQNLYLQRQLNAMMMRQHRNRARCTLEMTCLAFSWQQP